MKVITGTGEVIELGTTEAAPTIGIVDYSRRVTDDFGVTTVVQRGFSRRMSVRLALPFEAVDGVQRRLAGLRATSASWVADDRFDWLAARGFYKDFSLDLSVPPLSFCTLTIEGLAASEPFVDAGGDPAPEGQPSTFQLLQPVDIGGGQLVSNSVAEDDAPEWSAPTNYPNGARVIKAATHRVYESVIAGNLNDDPTFASGKWIDVGPTNRWAMFDRALGSVTSAAGAIAVTLAAGTVDAVALLDVTASTVRVQAPGYDRTVPSGAGTITFLDLPATNGQVTVTIAGDGQVSVGTLLVGRLVGLGLTEAAPSAGITDYSRKVVDEFGAVTVAQRAWAKKMTAAALIRTDALDTVANRIAGVRAKPSLWIGQAGLGSLTIYGFFKDFSIEVGETVSKLSLSIEGLSAAAKVEPFRTSVDWPDVGNPIGTRPADNADVTGANTAADTVAVAGRPAATLVADVDFNAEALIDEALRGTQRDALILARTTLAGKPIGTVIQEFRQESIAGDSALASLLTLLGAKSGDGTAFIIDLTTARVGPAETLAQRFTTLSAATGAVGGRIDDLRDIVVGPTGSVVARAVLEVTANGRISGYRNTNTGVRSAFYILADEFGIVQGEGGTALIPFKVVDGKVITKDLYADKLTVGAMDYEFVLKQTISPNQVSQTLPGGIVMKTGKYRATINNEVQLSILFDDPFPAFCQSFVPVPYINTFSDARDLWLQAIGEPSRFGAAVATQSSTSVNQSLDGFNWIAFGK